MEMLVIGRVYDKYAVYSYTAKDNVDVIDEYVLTKSEQVLGSVMCIKEFRIWKVEKKLTDRLIAIFYNEDEARAYLKTKEGVEI
jgi:hypothetical protein